MDDQTRTAGCIEGDKIILAALIARLYENSVIDDEDFEAMRDHAGRMAALTPGELGDAVRLRVQETFAVAPSR